MYLRDSDECNVLLRLIDDCDQLVGKNSLAAGAAYTIISEAAKHHSDHPGEARRRTAEREAATIAPPAPIPEPPAPPEVPEGSDAIDAVNAF